MAYKPLYLLTTLHARFRKDLELERSKIGVSKLTDAQFVERLLNLWEQKNG